MKAAGAMDGSHIIMLVYFVWCDIQGRQRKQIRRTGGFLHWDRRLCHTISHCLWLDQKGTEDLAYINGWHLCSQLYFEFILLVVRTMSSLQASGGSEGVKNDTSPLPTSTVENLEADADIAVVWWYSRSKNPRKWILTP